MATESLPSDLTTAIHCLGSCEDELSDPPLLNKYIDDEYVDLTGECLFKLSALGAVSSVRKGYTYVNAVFNESLNVLPEYEAYHCYLRGMLSKTEMC